MQKKLSRRRFVEATGAATVFALAGCTDGEEGEGAEDASEGEGDNETDGLGGNETEDNETDDLEDNESS